MSESSVSQQRRRFLRVMGSIPLLAAAPRVALSADTPLRRVIPATGEQVPVIGMGTWGTFDIGASAPKRTQRAEVMRRFLAAGGTLIDSSPMYGSSEENIGYSLAKLGGADSFSATKVWILGRERGVEQMRESMRLWGVQRFDLMQIHNFLDWETHLVTLREWKEAGLVRYIGITTSHGRRAADMARVIRSEPAFDFVQLTYNLADRDAERTLLPLAADHGKAVIVNRPFRRRQLINAVRHAPLPGFAAEIGCETWPQLLLKFIVSHPAVTCAIPATSQPDHMSENMAACYGPLPDDKQRRELLQYFARI